jgi:hypothetical protein
MAPKPGKLTLGILLGKGKPPEPETENDAEMGMGSGGEEELPPGLLEAVSEFRSAESDEDAAKALQRAVMCCED